jgi:hypothetical protein
VIGDPARCDSVIVAAGGADQMSLVPLKAAVLCAGCWPPAHLARAASPLRQTPALCHALMLTPHARWLLLCTLRTSRQVACGRKSNTTHHAGTRQTFAALGGDPVPWSNYGRSHAVHAVPSTPSVPGLCIRCLNQSHRTAQYRGRGMPALGGRCLGPAFDGCATA